MSYEVYTPKTNFKLRGDHSYNLSWCLLWWAKEKVYEKWQNNAKSTFVLHDGPPYANGAPHIGHAVNKILKDTINRTMAMLGHKINYIPGWDTNGLPIETQVEKEFKIKGMKLHRDISITEFRNECAKFAQKWIDIQLQEFQKMGVMADYKNHYTTMSKRSQNDILAEFHKFVNKGLVYRGFKPIMWSCEEKTSLANAEVEYKDKKSIAIDVAFCITSTKNKKLNDAKIVIWTTTPWTLFANRAIAYDQNLQYSLVKIENQKYILATNLIENFQQRSEKSVQILETFTGDILNETICKHPLHDLGYNHSVPLISCDFVTEQGTGFIHIAPGHGEDDFNLGVKHNLEITQLVDEKGIFTSNTPLVEGKFVHDANQIMINELYKNNCILAQTKITHSYPHSWRSGMPLIFRATPQWFISVKSLKENAYKILDDIKWIPESGRLKFEDTLESKPDWCISRQRICGIPLGIFFDCETNEIIVKNDILQKTQKYLDENGMESWWQDDTKHNILSQVFEKNYDTSNIKQSFEILDVWFDSGATQAFVLQNRNIGFPANVYLEGMDQHRAWFQSSILQACMKKPQTPCKIIMSHGFVVDKKGYKMSKSQGNVISPSEIIEKHGPDVLRLWVLTQNYENNLRWSTEQLNRVLDMEKRFRNTLRFLLGNLHYWNKKEVDYKLMPNLEKWILHRLAQLNKLHLQSLKELQFANFIKALSEFCSVDLSTLYFDIRKELLYCDTLEKSQSTRACLFIIWSYLIRWLAAFMPFGTEEAFYCYDQTQSIHNLHYIEISNEYDNTKIESYMQKMLDLRNIAYQKIEKLRQSKIVTSTHDVKITINSTFIDSLNEIFENSSTNNIIDDNNDNDLHLSRLREFLIISEITTSDDIKCMQNMIVEKHTGTRCPRCKRYFHDIKILCARCEKNTS